MSEHSRLIEQRIKIMVSGKINLILCPISMVKYVYPNALFFALHILFVSFDHQGSNMNGATWGSFGKPSYLEQSSRPFNSPHSSEYM